MNHWTQIVVVAAAFVLILVLGWRALTLFAGRGARGAARPAGADSVRSLVGEDSDSDLGADDAVLAEAEAEAEVIRARARRDAEAARRAADSEVESIRRSAQREADAVQLSAETAMRRAETAASDLLAEARRSAERDSQAWQLGLSQRESQLAERSAELDTRDRELAESLGRLERRVADLESDRAALDRDRDELATIRAAHEAERLAALELLAGLTAEEAKQELLGTVEARARRDAASLARSIEAEARAEGTSRARAIVAEAVQRVASEQTTETVVSVLHLPSDEMKGRIIGREGRNIRTFESVTGVNVIIDDTPEAVLLSCFDPVRREIGRVTLEKLVLDGRIHPHRIEEVYENAKVDVDELCLRAARDALAEVGVTGLDERLIPTLGRLKYRTSYGQNVLAHLIETAHIAGIMASELGLDPAIVKRPAFLHDIGKALTHEVEGSHAMVGADLLRRYGESDAVAHAVAAHHNEVQPKTVEAVLVQAADTCSAARPGARRESLESYVKRLERIEEIATARPGVEKVFAMQSGREVRVMVLPDEVDDLATGVIAREIAKQIEDELTYPGQIRVTVVRESRATEVAH